MEQKITLSISQLKWLFMAGMDRGKENIEIDMEDLLEQERTALDFDEFMLTVHGITI